MADSESDSVLTILKSLNEAVKTLKDDSTQLASRLDQLEAPPRNSGVVKTVVNNDIVNVESEDRNIFEASENDNVESDIEIDLQLHSFACQAKVGPKLGAQLAHIIDSDLVAHIDMSNIIRLREDHPRPENIPNLRVPKLNEEILPADSELHKEQVLVGIQQDVTTALTLMAELMDDQSRTNHKYSRQDIFAKANDVAAILMHTHKEITLARKQNVKSMLQSGLHSICTRKHMKETERTSNVTLFEEDLGGEVDKNLRKKRIINKISKNYQSGNQRFPQSVQRFRFRPYPSRGRGAPRGDAYKRGRGRGQPQSRGHPQSRGRGKSSRM